MMKPLALCLLGSTFSTAAIAQATPLADLVVRCAPRVAPRTALAIIAVESDGYPWSVHDNDTNYSHRFPDRDAAETYVRLRLAADPAASIDIGLAQLNSANLPGLGLSVGMAFEPCTNIAMGMRVLQDAYVSAVARFGLTRRALFEAFAAYNGGTRVFTTSNVHFRQRVERYATAVWATAERLRGGL